MLGLAGSVRAGATDLGVVLAARGVRVCGVVVWLGRREPLPWLRVAEGVGVTVRVGVRTVSALTRGWRDPKRVIPERRVRSIERRTVDRVLGSTGFA